MVTPPELYSLTETLADTYVVTITQVADQLQEGSSPQQREYAQQLKTFVGTSAYILAASPNPEASLIDLAVNVSIHRRLLSSGLAELWFGSRAAPLLDAYAKIEETAWTTLGRVYTEQQSSALRDGIARWWAENEHTTLQLVRLPDLAKYRDLSIVDSPGGVRLLEPVAEANKTAMELRLLGERSLFVAQRFPYIVQWHGQEAFYDTLATPEVRTAIDDVHTIASGVHRVAGVIAGDSHPDDARGTLAAVGATLREAAPLVREAHQLIGGLNDTLQATDRLLATLRGRDSRDGGANRSAELASFTAALRELGAAAHELDSLVGNTARLVESPAFSARPGAIQGDARGPFGGLAALGDGFIDRVFCRILALIAAFFAILLAYRIALARITRWASGRPTRHPQLDRAFGLARVRARSEDRPSP